MTSPDPSSASGPKAPRFFIDQPLARGAEIPLPEFVVRHIAALRLVPGDAVTLFNGEGGEHAAVLLGAARGSARARIGTWSDRERESPLAITLALGLSAGDRMDWAIQKASELGVHAIRPVMTERAVVRLSAERAEKRLAHWRGVAASACEQCGRNRVPLIAPVVGIDDFIAEPAGTSTRLLMSPEATVSIGTLARADGFTLLIGPEGGLSPAETSRALARGYVTVHCGPRILRTETAPLAAIAALQALHGDMG